KGGSYKIIPVSKWLISSLEAIAPKKKKGYIFISKRSNSSGKPEPLTDVRKALKTACTVAKVSKHVTPHLFRHSIATYGMGKNVNLRVIQNYLGHADIGTTEFYTHVQNEHLA